MPDPAAAGLLPGLSFPDFLLAFFSLLLEGVPFLLFGAMLSGLVDLFLPPDLLKRILPRSRVKGVGLAIVAGFVFPLCECSGIPVIARLIRKGLPVGVAVTYLLAAPLVNPLTLLTTYLAFMGQDPWMIVGLRLGLGVIVLFILGMWISHTPPERFLQPRVLSGDLDTADDAGYRAALTPGLRLPALGQFVGTTIRDFLGVLVYFILGAAFAAFFSTSVNRALLEPIGSSIALAPVVGVSLAYLLCLCSSTDAFIIATFRELALNGKLAFLVAGPLFDAKLYWMYQALFRRGFVLALWWRVTALTLIVTWLYGIS